MTLFDGRALAARIRRQTSSAVEALRAEGVEPRLGIVMPSGDEAAAAYVGAIERAAALTGVAVTVVRAERPSADETLARVAELAADPLVHDVLCQTPLPSPLAGEDAFAPATAQAVIEILDAAAVPLEGARAVVVGRSAVVGKPLAALLLARDATVTVCHSRTRDLAGATRTADVLVAAAGRPRLVGADAVGAGTVVVDVGTNADADGGLVGDVAADEVERAARLVTPVPAGVGPVTTAVLLRNVATAATF